jgi:hypothetical protein
MNSQAIATYGGIKRLKPLRSRATCNLAVSVEPAAVHRTRKALASRNNFIICVCTSQEEGQERTVRVLADRNVVFNIICPENLKRSG